MLVTLMFFAAVYNKKNNDIVNLYSLVCGSHVRYINISIYMYVCALFPATRSDFWPIP